MQTEQTLRADSTRSEIEALFEVVRTLCRRGVPVIYISHRLREIFAIGDRVTVMRDGQLLQVGSPEDIYHRPVDRFVDQVPHPGRQPLTVSRRTLRLQPHSKAW